MSRGPGRIERAISEILCANPDNAYTIEELGVRIYGRPVLKKHRVALLRAISKVMERDENVVRIDLPTVATAVLLSGSKAARGMAEHKLHVLDRLRSRNMLCSETVEAVREFIPDWEIPDHKRVVHLDEWR